MHVCVRGRGEATEETVVCPDNFREDQMKVWWYEKKRTWGTFLPLKTRQRLRTGKDLRLCPRNRKSKGFKTTLNTGEEVKKGVPLCPVFRGKGPGDRRLENEGETERRGRIGVSHLHGAKKL